MQRRPFWLLKNLNLLTQIDNAAYDSTKIFTKKSTKRRQKVGKNLAKMPEKSPRKSTKKARLKTRHKTRHKRRHDGRKKEMEAMALTGLRIFHLDTPRNSCMGLMHVFCWSSLGRFEACLPFILFSRSQLFQTWSGSVLRSEPEAWGEGGTPIYGAI